MNVTSIAACALILLLSPILSRAQDFVPLRNPSESPEEQLKQYLTGIGLRYLQERDQELADVKSRSDMERRKKLVRDKILRLIGGLPEYRGPLNVSHAGTLDRKDYRIEKIIYESLPGFYVPANVYVPNQGEGPFPAILNPVGHSKEGKAGEWELAVGLVRKGFVVLKFDPIGQGERLQYYDPELRASKVGGPTDEHSHANGHTMLIGDNISRYEIWDGMRGIDYLLSRRDVDPNRIGCSGCSGGGTQATYISALDDRVKVAAPSCYVNSWQEMLTGPGPQDAEQAFPNFLAEHLNFADYIELFAPKPWLIASTIQDMFPLEGARQTYEEARTIYALYEAEDRLRWHVGPGPHGIPRASREAICAWFIKWLQDGKGDAREPELEGVPADQLLTTQTGQVSDSLHGETVWSLTKKRAADLIPIRKLVSSRAELEDFRARIVREISSTAAITTQPGGSAPSIKVHESIERDTYHIDLVTFEPEKGIQIPGILAIPNTAGSKPVVLLAETRSKQVVMAPGGDLDELAKSGSIVLAIQPRGIPKVIVNSSFKDSAFVDDQPIAALAAVVGKTLLGMRAEDIVRAVDYLTSREDADRNRITAVGRGPLGMALLHAAVLDIRIGQIVLSETLTSYQLALERPLHRNFDEVGLNGVLKKYDVDDLLVALGTRPVTILNPVDPMGVPIRPEEFREHCRYAFESDARLGWPDRVRVASTGRQQSVRKYIR